ncbi:CHASE3 domain-containing protein [Planktothrix sp. FACHB-1355]|uniref:CHASE3 domain-containing protein n=1 Tax=Aerosakkonema funiforme FACHB-1375 TaxID=2949571 RepID=A0A926VJW8_9CYAN|nr:MULTISPECIES: methyl-accepting chemotaxis protein [Oscillatoriales]MBD2185320.1 CHASE3 domain-containing protein [Aerosakkonema funiforme FACHB-1375]MBD3560597.1 CHASE3 domain-containing protein [Planktothrix sp. FACHB-1355]
MLGNLKLRGRILVGYGVPIPLSFLLALLVYSNTNLVAQSLSQANASRDALEITDRMESEASAMERSTRGYLLTRQQSYLDRFKQASESLSEASTSAEKLIKDSKQEFFSNEQKNIFDRLVLTVKRLRSLDERMINLVRNGKGSEAIKIFVKDESALLSSQIKDLNNTFNDIALKQLRQTQSNTTNSLELLTWVAVFGTLIAAIASVIFGLLLASNIQQAINKNVSTIATSSNEIAASVEQQERSASQQAAAVNQTTITMDELGVSSKASAEQAEAARLKVDRIAQQIMQLSEQLSQINSIANLVSDIANQTNMLAINAAVEAVRAGEQGKGFAVVATEIRRLADQSKRSAEKIATLVADLQNTTKASVLITDANMAGIEGIVSAVNNISVNIQQISLNVRQQALAIDQVVTAMNDFNESAQQTAAGINQTRVSVLQLNETAKNLKSVIS